MNFSDTVLLLPSCLRAWPRIETEVVLLLLPATSLLRCLTTAHKSSKALLLLPLLLLLHLLLATARCMQHAKANQPQKSLEAKTSLCVLLLPLSCSDVAAAVIDIIIGHLLLQALSAPFLPPSSTSSSQLLLLNFLCVVCAQRVDIFRPCFLVWHNCLSSSSSTEAAASAASTSLRLLGVPPPPSPLHSPSSLDSRE